MKSIQNCLAALFVVLFGTIFSQVVNAQERNFQLAQTFGGQNDSDAIIRLNRAEEQIRNLTGQIEELNHQIRQMSDLIRRLREDTDYRLQEIEGGTGSASIAGDSNLNPPSDLEPIQPILPDQSDQALSGSDPSVGVLGQLNPNPELGEGTGAVVGTENVDQPLDLIPFPNNGDSTLDLLNPDANNQQLLQDNVIPSTQPTTGQQISGQQLYNVAYTNLFEGNYDEAARLFNQFLDENPEDPLTGVALFFLGESYFAKRMYKEATDAYLKSYTDYPNSEKVSESLLQMGISLSGMGEQELACQTLTEFLNKFPNAPDSVLTRAKAEYDRVECT